MLRRNKPCFAAVCLVFIGWSSAGSGAEGNVSVSPSRVTSEVVRLTNAERTRLGRGRLRANPRLMQAAQVHAEQIARAGQLAHVLPDAAYPRAEDRLAAAGYRWRSYGENVALGQPTAAAVIRGWMHSRGHRKNLVSPAFTEMGVGYALDRAGRPYYVQVFADPFSS